MALTCTLSLSVLLSCFVLYIYPEQAAKEKHASVLSHEVHRVGYHFPSAVVEKACTSLSVTLSSSGRVIYKQGAVSVYAPVPSKKKKSKKKKKKGSVLQQAFPQIEASQAEIDTEATQAIRDLFPKIPEENLLAVVQLAFKKV